MAKDKVNCIPTHLTTRFLENVKNGKIDPEKMATMNSKERRNFLGGFVGKEHAKWVNTEFESKLLLKSQQKGMVTWAKKIGGITEATRRDIVSKINKLESVMDPKSEQVFLEDIVERRLGMKVSEEQASEILKLTKELQKFQEGTVEYGKAYVKLMNYINKESPKASFKVISDPLSIARAVKTGFDVSAIGRQGAAYIGTKEWLGAASHVPGYYSIRNGRENIDMLRAEIYGHKYSKLLLQVKRELGLTLLGESFTEREEELSSRFIEKIPLLNGSSRAYEGFLNDLRFNRFVNLVSELEKSGNPAFADKGALKDLAKVIAAATGRGSLGGAESAANAFATVMFSPRWVTSKVQLIMNPITKRGPSQKEAAKALARVVGVSVALLGLLHAAGGDVEEDPRSADFGKVRIGNTSFDLTGGTASYITLIARLLPDRLKGGTTKSSYDGALRRLNTGKFGSRTRASVVGEFLSNKFSPMARAIWDSFKGETFEGDKIDLEQPPAELVKIFADQLLTPLLWSETVDAIKDAEEDNGILLGVLAGASSMFGVSTTTFIRKDSKKKKRDRAKVKKFQF